MDASLSRVFSGRPNPSVISVPVVFGLPSGDAKFSQYVNTWIRLSKSGWWVDRLYSY